MKASYARRQQWRRLRKAASRGAGAAVAILAAALAASANQAVLAILLVLMAGVLTLASRHALGLARRSRVGVESEMQVRRALQALARDGWHVRHAVDWPRGGDLDHVVRSPSGMGFVIETKTLRYSRAHVVRTIEAARWVGRRRRRYPCGVVPVICVVGGRSLERQDGNLLIVSLDRLLPAMRVVAATGGRIRALTTRLASAVAQSRAATRWRMDEALVGFVPAIAEGRDRALSSGAYVVSLYVYEEEHDPRERLRRLERLRIGRARRTQRPDVRARHLDVRRS
jgi:hypothetical protein